MSASYRSSDWFPSTGSRQALSMLEMDKKVENLVTDHGVRHDQDVASDHSLCSKTCSPTSCRFHATPFYGGGYNHAADTPPSYHSHAEQILSALKKFLMCGIYNERFCHGNGLSSPDFQASASTTTQSFLQPYGELSFDDSRHFPSVDLPNYPSPISESVHVSQQFLVPRSNLPIDSADRLVNERSFGWTENLVPSLGNSGLRQKFYREARGLGSVPEEYGGPGLEYGLKSFSRESLFLSRAMTKACAKHTGSAELNGFEMGSRHNVLCERGSFSAPASGSNLDNDFHWTVLDEAKQEVSHNDFFYRCGATLDSPTERNRGLRASRLKGKSNMIAHDDFGHLNQHGCRDARFFVIKSYSEDNVHKSIKYGVWASTANGNKKLDAAYGEAKEKERPCPVFLFFSVNASAQFCGVAEMVGPVDFKTSVEYWQQDRWTGHFSVKWLIIKDVPNSLFRHIILENNDNKPVTNSRDSQEVGLEQGLEMLSIFKNHEMNSSILDDFSFYEERQRATQSRKARRRAVLGASTVPATAVSALPTSSLHCSLVKNMSKSFAEALALDHSSK